MLDWKSRKNTSYAYLSTVRHGSSSPRKFKSKDVLKSHDGVLQKSQGGCMLKRRSTWRTLPSKMKKMRYTLYALNSSILVFKIPVYLRAVGWEDLAKMASSGARCSTIIFLLRLSVLASGASSSSSSSSSSSPPPAPPPPPPAVDIAFCIIGQERSFTSPVVYDSLRYNVWGALLDDAASWRGDTFFFIKVEKGGNVSAVRRTARKLGAVSVQVVRRAEDYDRTRAASAEARTLAWRFVLANQQGYR